MWISRKRVLLWHTARNILAIFYTLQIVAVSCCPWTEFTDVQSKALTSETVIVGVVTELDYSAKRAFVQVSSVLKEPQEGSINRRDIILVTGLVSTEFKTKTSDIYAQGAGDVHRSTIDSTSQQCYSYVNGSSEYILFINRTQTSTRQDVYKNANLAVDYTKSDKKLIKSVVCKDCASAPNAKTKRHVQTYVGAHHYKLTCRVEGNPLPNVQWLKDGEVVDSSIRGIVVKVRRRKNVVKTVIRFKQVKASHAGLYQCVGTNVLGQDVAKAKFKTIKTTTEETLSAGDVDLSSLYDIDAEDSMVSKESEQSGSSHYIQCTGRDRDYCLHGGECRVFPDGRYKHCKCLARFKGARCEEANVIEAIPPPVQSPTGARIDQDVELVNIVTALASILAVLIILLLLLAFYCAGWRYSRRRGRRLEQSLQQSMNYQKPMEARHLLLDEADGRGIKSHHEAMPSRPPPSPVKQCHTVATQTDPEETSLQQLRRSLNLENHFPHSTSDVVLRRKSSQNGLKRRPTSNPLERRPTTRSRLSGTSTLTDSKRLPDFEFETVVERPTPTEPTVNLEQLIENHQSEPATHPRQAICDTRRAAKLSLYISESSLTDDAMPSDSAPTVVEKTKPCLHPLILDSRAKAGPDTYHNMPNGKC